MADITKYASAFRAHWSPFNISCQMDSKPRSYRDEPIDFSGCSLVYEILLTRQSIA